LSLPPQSMNALMQYLKRRRLVKKSDCAYNSPYSLTAEGIAALVEMTVDVRDKKQLEKLCSAMRRISGVRDVERLVNQ